MSQKRIKVVRKRSESFDETSNASKRVSTRSSNSTILEQGLNAEREVAELLHNMRQIEAKKADDSLLHSGTQRVPRSDVDLPPFIQKSISAEMTFRFSYISPTLAKILHNYEDVKTTWSLNISYIRTLCEKDKTFSGNYLCRNNIQTLIDTSPKADYFKKNVITNPYLKLKEIKEDHLVALIRTHFYDSDIAGFDVEKSKYQINEVKLSSELAEFLGLKRAIRQDAFKAIVKYIIEHQLIDEKNVVHLDDKLYKVFHMRKINKNDFDILIREHYIPDDTFNVQLVKTNDIDEKFIEENYFKNRDNKLHGSITKYYTNGRIKYSSYFNNGVEDGIRRTWYENGNIRSLTRYNNGVMNNITILYDMQGNVLHRADIDFGLVKRVLIGY